MAAIDWSTVLLPEPFSPTRAMIGYLRSKLVFVQPRRPSISTHSKRFGHPVEEAQRAVSLRISLLSIRTPPMSHACRFNMSEGRIAGAETIKQYHRMRLYAINT